MNTAAATMTSSKVSTGNYTIKAAGRTFDLDRCDDRSWALFEVVYSPALESDKREYWQHFDTKRSALHILQRYIVSEPYTPPNRRTAL